MPTPCYICQEPIDEITVDPRTLKPNPCNVCLDSVREALEIFEVNDDDA
jgi:hypothetical protein